MLSPFPKKEINLYIDTQNTDKLPFPNKVNFQNLRADEIPIAHRKFQIQKGWASEHVTEKWEPVFRVKRCDNNKIERGV